MQKTAITKTLLVMRLTAILLTVSFLQVYASGSAQSVTLSGKNITLKQVFAAIKQQTGYVVFYNQKMLSDTKPVSLTVYDMPLREFLKLVFTNQPVNYIIQDKTIVLSRKKIAGEKTPAIDNIPVDDEFVRITGMVRSTEGDYLPGVSVRIKNTNTGTTTDNFGLFQLKRIPENAVIEISNIGYETVEFAIVRSGDRFQLTTESKASFTVDNTSNPGMIMLKLTLKKSLSILDETQVIAYGKTSRRYSTGSVGTVKGEEIRRQPVMNVLQALEGRVAGLTVTPSTGNSAAPIKVEIRGRNSLNPDALSEPLYIVDGVPQGALNVGFVLGSSNLNTGAVQAGMTNTSGESPLLYLNPMDIESIDVLKDADATAIYGARGANGVIIITTKRGKPGPTRFNLSINKGKTTIPRKLKLLNTEEYLAMRREALRNDGLKPDIYNAPDLMLWDQNKSTDWQDYFFAPGEQTNINAGVSGGMGQTNYSLNAGYQSQQELMNQGGKNIRGSFAGSLSHASANQKFQFSFLSNVSIISVDAIRPDNYIFTPPNAPDIYNEKGEFNFEPYRGQYLSNFPFGQLKRPSESKTAGINTNLQLSYEIIKGLTVSANGGYNFTNNDNAWFTPAAASDPLFGNMSSAYFGKSSTNNWLVEAQAQYRTLIGKGNLSVQLGTSLQNVKNTGITTLAFMFPNDLLIRSPNNAQIKQSFDGSGEYKFNAGFAIINYRWDNKYIINLNARRDGSSKFGPGRQFGNFGSVGLAWIVSEEKWMKKWLPAWWTYMKFRGSYGVTGSDAVGDYEFLTRWGGVIGSNSNERIFDYNGTRGFNLTTPVNQDFRWETTNKFEVSASLGFMKDRINIEANYYNNRSGNQLALVGTPFYTGFGNIRANRPAVVENSGIELTMNGRILDTKNWHVSANFNFSINNNKLVDYPGLEQSPYADLYAIGQSLNLKYLYHYIGINPTTGDYVFEDYNKDGVISSFNSVLPKSPSDDRYVAYDLNPDYSGGFGVQVAYKGFALATQFIFRKQLKEDPYFALQIGTMKNVFIPEEVANNHWKNPGDIALYPKYTTNALNYVMRSSDRYYTDASYVKLGTLAFSYDLPTALLQKMKIQSCRFTINTQNVFTITSYRGIDPEISLGNTPVTRTISSGLTFTF